MSAKLGEPTKAIPSTWLNKIRISDDMSVEEIDKSIMQNELLLNRKPYFFRYLYKGSNKEYKEYHLKQSKQCMVTFSKDLETLLNQDELSEEEIQFVKKYYEWCPLIINNSVMNKICRYIENFNFKLKQKLKTPDVDFNYSVYKNNEIKYSAKDKKIVLKEFSEFISNSSINRENSKMFENENEEEVESLYVLNDCLNKVCSNEDIILNILIDYLYDERPNSRKETLWQNYGQKIFENIKKNTNATIKFPFKDENGDMLYLNEKYSLKEVEI